MQIHQKKEIISATKDLYVFNPEHDMALGVNVEIYTPPNEVVKLRKEKSLLPAIYAGNSDFILIPDDLEDRDLPGLEYYDLVKDKDNKLIRYRDLHFYKEEIRRVIPWGWDRSIRFLLANSGIDREKLPTNEIINKIRELSHRRTVIEVRNVISSILNEPPKNLPKELFSLSEVEIFLQLNPVSFFKAPWSSSGRGIVVSDHISRKGLLEWCHGIIKKQKSVMAERAWDRLFDFATEWDMIEGEAFFRGYSVFKASSRGKYHGNITGSQNELKHLISLHAPKFNCEIINAQKTALEKIIGKSYTGPLGIDLLADTQGEINACVEINLRNTMGHILLEFQKKD
ncbi:MAG: hypothetical protein J1F12_08655 [Muribaculaceae bacterium]|nr:hypothetical protein [Muribaculaceae bacterium]